MDLKLERNKIKVAVNIEDLIDDKKQIEAFKRVAKLSPHTYNNGVNKVRFFTPRVVFDIYEHYIQWDMENYHNPDEKPIQERPDFQCCLALKNYLKKFKIDFILC